MSHPSPEGVRPLAEDGEDGSGADATTSWLTAAHALLRFGPNGSAEAAFIARLIDGTFS